MRGNTLRRAFVSGLVAIAAVAVMTACSSSGTQHGTQAAPSQPTVNQASTSSASARQASTTTVPGTTASPSQEFVSKRYGFDVTVPAGWSPADGTINWPGIALTGPGGPVFAHAADPGGRWLNAASAPVPTGTQLADWRTAMVNGAGPLCTPNESLSPIAGGPSVETATLGGEPALAWLAHCSDGNVNKIVALHNGRGFMMYMGAGTTNPDPEAERIFETIRQSFRFTN
jgi:hypothetical protein